MTPDGLKRAAILLFGKDDYAKELSGFLGRERTQVWRYLNGRTPIPALIARVVLSEVKSRKGAGRRTLTNV